VFLLQSVFGLFQNGRVLRRGRALKRLWRKKLSPIGHTRR
jgi:hypothetical protein